MTQSLAENDANDLYLTPQGNIATVAGIDAVVQLCRAIMETQLGEVALDTARGIPTFDTAWLSWNPAQFEIAARRALLSIDNVTAVTSFNVSRADGAMIYTVEIETTFGIGTVTNG